jgi:hypothetical protein
MRTATRILAVSNAGLVLPVDDGAAASTADKLDDVLSEGWQENDTGVGAIINQVMQADSLLAYQEKELEVMVLRSKRVYSTKTSKKSI